MHTITVSAHGSTWEEAQTKAAQKLREITKEDVYLTMQDVPHLIAWRLVSSSGFPAELLSGEIAYVDMEFEFQLCRGSR